MNGVHYSESEAPLKGVKAMKYAVLTNNGVGPLAVGPIVITPIIRPNVHPTKVYIVEAETPKKAMNAVKKHFNGQAVNVIDAVEVEELLAESNRGKRA